jgi:predicted ATPase
LREAGNLPIEGRVGVNTGEVVVRSITTGAGQTEYTPIGHTTNLASRMQALAPTGSIAVSEPTRKLVEGYFALKPLGPTRVKGLSEPVNVYEVTGLGPLRTRLQRAAGRGLTKFVGRDREIEALGHAADQAKAGHGQLVAAMAEAGAGKSRLYFEFKAKNQSGWMVLETFSISHGKASAYLPVIDLLRNYFGISSDDDERKRREKVTGRVVALDRSLEETLPYLFSLLGIVDGVDPLAQMDARIKKSRTLEAIKRIVLRESLSQPLIVIFEDLHWIDEQTQEFLNLLADSIATAKILLLVNYRPEYSHQWTSKTYYTQLRLDPLGDESAHQMLSALLGDSSTPRPDHDEGQRGDQPRASEDDLIALKRLIIERTEGNPFFVEEIVQALFEEGVLLRNGSVKVARSMNAVKVPTTVQGVLAARIDRLPADEKELLQTLSVIGREFPLSLIRAVTQNPHPRGTAPAQHGAGAAPLALSRNAAGEGSAELERILADLQLAEFIYEQPAVGDTEYLFKHALTQEVAYNSLLIERRKLLHERIGNALESIFANQLDDHLDELAHHYDRSANTRQAVKYLQFGGEKAVQRSANIQAIEYLTKSLVSLRTLPNDLERDRRELAMQIAIGPPMIAVKGYAASEVQTAYERSQELCNQLGERSQAFPIQFALSIFHLVRGQHQEAHEIAERLLETAEKSQDPSLLVVACSAAGVSSFWMGELPLARTHLERAADLYDRQRDRPLAAKYGTDMGVVSFSYLGWTLWYLGYPDQAVKAAQSTLSIATELPHSNSLGMGLSHTSLLYLHIRDEPQTQRLAEAAINLSSEGEFAQWMAEGTIFRGWALAQQGREAEGIRELQSGLAAWQLTGGGNLLPQSLGWLAEALGRTGKIDEGLGLAETALEIVSKSGERVHEAEVCRLKGELLIRRDSLNTSEAQGCFERAIEIAREQSAKSLELRATLTLARLIASQDRRDEARTILADIYNWFTEGFDTPDLIDAKSLLDELRT